MGTDGLMATGVYILSQNFEVSTVSRSDTYWDAHRRVEKEGLLKHSVEQCPERKSPPNVRVWDPEKGWREAAH